MPKTIIGAHSAKCASTGAVGPSPAGTSYLKAPTDAPLIGGDKVTVGQLRVREPAESIDVSEKPGDTAPLLQKRRSPTRRAIPMTHHIQPRKE